MSAKHPNYRKCIVFCRFAAQTVEKNREKTTPLCSSERPLFDYCKTSVFQVYFKDRTQKHRFCSVKTPNISFFPPKVA